MSNIKKDVKSQAAALSERLKSLGVDIKNTQALEAVSALLNSSDWNRLNARLNALTASDTPFQRREHKILVGAPGVGKTHTLMNIFKRELEKGEKAPVFVTFQSAKDVLQYWESTSDILTQCQVINVDYDSSNYITDVEPIDPKARGIIVVLSTSQTHSAFMSLMLIQFMRQFKNIFGTHPSCKIGTLMFDEIHLANSYDQIRITEIELTRKSFQKDLNLSNYDNSRSFIPSISGFFSYLNHVLDTHQPIESIEQVIISTQVVFNSSELSCFHYPIKTLMYGALPRREEMDIRHVVESFGDKPTHELFLGSDRYVEDIFWHTCAVRSNREDVYGQWHSTKHRGVTQEPQHKTHAPGPIIEWLNEENDKRKKYTHSLFQRAIKEAIRSEPDYVIYGSDFR
ncbi:glyoxalase superfamily protein [Pseudomonas syringae pv. actinidiae]|nr:glyoxalase superfamily protein [Pseudomonas syringae pv. actinidiae]